METGWGILGTGSVARRFAASLRQVRGARLTKVASRDPENARRFAAAFGGEAAQDQAELLRADDVQVVYVATPTPLHAEHSIRCLGAGKAVLCEKPLATSVAQIREVIAAAHACRRFLMEALWTRFLPLMCLVRDRVAAGELGALRLLQADLALPEYDDGIDLRTRPGPGSGALLDLGAYPVSLALDLLGRPDDVRSHVLRSESDVDWQAVLTLIYPEATAVLTTGFFGRGRNGGTLIGERGTMHLSAPLYAPELLTTTHWRPERKRDATRASPGRVDRMLRRSALLSPAYRALLPLLRVAARLDRKTRRPFASFGYQFQAIEVQRRLLAREFESPLMSWDHSVAIQEILEAARKS